MRLFRLLCAGTICALAGSAASAGTAPAFIFPYQENATTNCGQSFCTVSFPKLVKETVVQQVSCLMTGLADVQPTSAALQTSVGTTQITLPVFSYAAVGTAVALGINTATSMFFAHGETPSISIETTDTLKEMNCTITGYHS